MKSVLRGCLWAVVSCVPHRDLPPDQIETLASLKDVMDVQATIADPQFSKIDQPDSYGAEDWVAFADLANRIQVTSRKAKQFSKGAEFDAFADHLHQQAETLGSAAVAKDKKAAADALTQMKATCKGCHAKFR